MAHPPLPEMQSTPPRTPYEEVVYGIWRDVLSDVIGTAEFGVHDDFFELGGHSLAAPRVVARIRKTLGVQVPVGQFFGCRTVAALAAAISDQTNPPHTIERRPAGTQSVLSFDQQRLWLENQLQPSLAYNVHGRQKLTGPLDIPAFAASVRTILDRHEALRTRFPTVNGQPVQVVDDLPDTWQLDYRDVSDQPDPTQAATDLANQQATTTFDLAAGNLFRCQLIKTGETEHVLSLTAHHIICDDWSVGIFTRELSTLYQHGGTTTLDPLPIQYADYATWQRQHLTGQTLDNTVNYWRHHLADAPPPLTMPVGHERAVVRALGERARGYLSEEETAALHALCRKHGVSPFMVLMTTLATVLARWSGQRDLIIGVPVAGRHDAGTDALIGFFINTLPIRVTITDESTFTELLAHVRQVCLDAYAHADAPLDVLVQQLDITRDPRRTALFQVTLNVVGTVPTTQLAGIAVQSLDTSTTMPPKFDLSVNVQESNDCMQLQLDYNPDRYDPPMMDTLVAHVEALLRAAIDDPTRGVLDYPLGDSPAQPDAGEESSAGDRPSVAFAHTAVSAADGDHTYAWLAGAASAITAHLPAAGHVGLVRRRSATFIAAILACQHAGLEYTVIDPDSDVPPIYLGITEVVDVGALAIDPADTGEDVAIRRHAWAAEQYDLTADDRVAALTHHPGHLVSAVSNAVAAGATVHLPPAFGPADISDWLRDRAITVVFASAPQLRTFSGDLPALRYAFVDNPGDLLAEDVGLLRDVAPACHLITTYRPDRTGVPIAVHRIPAPWTDPPLRVPLGRELSGRPVRLAHAADQPAAVGEVAELRLGTRGTGDLARRWTDDTLEYVGRVGTNPAYDPIQTVRVLRNLPDVTDAIVVEYADAEGNPALVGYLTGPDAAEPGATLRQQLLPRLPGYLVPVHLFVVDELPRTPDGDYDLAALPEPDEDDLAGERYVAPRTPIERQLAEIFKELLGLERIGVHDSFFELNGFSLLATQMTARVRDTFKVDLPLREVFGSPTVEGVARLILWKQSEQSDVAALEAMLAEIEAEP
jgi:non-ribosomal peptide synthetase component F/acyl carrier protein